MGVCWQTCAIATIGNNKLRASIDISPQQLERCCHCVLLVAVNKSKVKVSCHFMTAHSKKRSKLWTMLQQKIKSCVLYRTYYKKQWSAFFRWSSLITMKVKVHSSRRTLKTFIPCRWSTFCKSLPDLFLSKCCTCKYPACSNCNWVGERWLLIWMNNHFIFSFSETFS